jgi:selenium metabolism protein YedF
MPCPAPVVATRHVLAGAGKEIFEVLVDAGAPRENVVRFARSRGCEVQEHARDEYFSLTIATNEAPLLPSHAATVTVGPRIMLITSDCLGDGSRDLGRLLMKNFIITLLDMAGLPDQIFFLNAAVQLTTEGSEVIPALVELGNRGVEIFSCGLCLDYYHKEKQLKVGTTTNMFTVAESLLVAGSVIRI